MKASSSKACDMVKESCHTHLATPILEPSRTTSSAALEYTSSKMEGVMKGTGKVVSDPARECESGAME